MEQVDAERCLPSDEQGVGTIRGAIRKAGAGDKLEPAPVSCGHQRRMFMQCEASFDSGPHHAPCCDLGAAITFDDIKTDDRVLIKTRNSEYRFSVIDPSNHKGMLSGGTLGEEPREAFLIESRSKGEDGALRDFRGLKTGARALFYLSSGRGLERVTTSKISGLTLVRAADRTSLIS